MAEIEVIPDVDNLGVANWLHGRLSAAMASSEGAVQVTLPGGSTPFPILEKLGEMAFDWPRITAWPGDDRLVPEDHHASNYGHMRFLLEPLGAKVVRLEENSNPPHFALAWLGMGADGHIASLFPSSDPKVDDPLKVRRIVPDPLPPEAPFERVSMTIPALLDADEILFVIRGPDKRAVFEAAMRGENDLPVARLLRAATQPVTCFA